MILKIVKKTIVVFFVGGWLLIPGPVAWGVSKTELPVSGMVTMIDLGASECIPCKMMAPIMVKLEKVYAGKAAIIFIDVWKDRSQAKRFKIRAIPTQIFFDKDGKEIFRHVGFMGEKDIIEQLRKMGIP
jgi:thioredoxin 1